MPSSARRPVEGLPCPGRSAPSRYQIGWRLIRSQPGPGHPDPTQQPNPPTATSPPNTRETHQASLWATGVSAKHPIHYALSRPTAQGCLPIDEALNLKRNGVRAKVGGVVTHRQRPATSKGVIFINLEDETGLLNVAVTPETWNRHRNVARRNPGLTIHVRPRTPRQHHQPGSQRLFPPTNRPTTNQKLPVRTRYLKYTKKVCQECGNKSKPISVRLYVHEARGMRS